MDDEAVDKIAIAWAENKNDFREKLKKNPVEAVEAILGTKLTEEDRAALLEGLVGMSKQFLEDQGLAAIQSNTYRGINFRKKPTRLK